jgi:tRNA threonylcarbamoyladenosine biosynthesis protein TsaE
MTTILATLNQHCRQEADTATYAERLAVNIQRFIDQNPNAHLNIALEGDLGAGKTTFARHLIQSLGHTGKVKSPTYTLCEPYPLVINNHTFTAHHFDLYRMRDPLEWREAGFVELFDVPGFCLIEWPEKAEGTLPPFDIQIQLTSGPSDEERNITINAFSDTGKSVIEGINTIGHE